MKRELEGLRTSYNPDPMNTGETANIAEETEECFVHVAEGEPLTFNQAWFHENETNKNKWREAIMKEIYCMHDKRVWKNVTNNTLEEMPQKDREKKPIGCKWVFKIKRNGIYRARLVVLGYKQIKGIDYDDNYSPVVKDICHRVLMARILKEKKWKKP